MAESTTKNIVTGALASVVVAGHVINVQHGGEIPEAVDAATVEHLKSVGLVEEVTVETATTEEVDAIVVPEGVPAEAWKGEQLRAYAVREQIEVPSSAKTKADIVAVLLDHAAAKAKANEQANERKDGEL